MPHNNKEIALVGSKGETLLVKRPDGRVTGGVNGLFGELRDDRTGLIRIPSYKDADQWMDSLVRGMSSDSFSPLRDSDLSSVITRRQAMAYGWEVYGHGRTSPVSRFSEIMNMANDGQGASTFASDVVGAWDTCNRGVFFTFIPIENTEIEDWESLGVEIRPFDTESRRNNLFTINVNTERLRPNFGLWSLDSLLCHPTGNPKFPFWYEKDDNFFLIPNTLGDQVVQRVGGKSHKYAGWGQCGTWRYVGIMVVDQLIREMEIESLINEPPRGFVWLKGADHPGQLEDVLRANQEALQEGDAMFYPGRIFGESVNPQADIIVKPWTEAPSGYVPSRWRTFREDALAAAFHMSVAFIRLRIGTGAFSQSDVSAELQSETGIAVLQTVLQQIYNRVTPRVKASVVIPNDRAEKRKYERLNMLGDAVKKLQDATDGEALTSGEIRQMIQEVGVELKDEGENITRKSGNKEEEIADEQ